MDDPQALQQCPHCVSKVKANRMSLHINRVHRNVQGKQQCVLNADHKVDDMHQHLEEDCSAMAELKKNAYDSGGISTVPPLTRCQIDYGENVENWDGSNYPTYAPLVATDEKNIIRGFYVSGLKPAEKKNAIQEERNRRAELTEKQNKKSNQISHNNTGFPSLNPPQRGTSYNRNPGKGYPRAPGGPTNINDVSTRQPEPARSDTESNRATTDSDGYTVVKRTKGVGRGRGRVPK